MFVSNKELGIYEEKFRNNFNTIISQLQEYALFTSFDSQNTKDILSYLSHKKLMLAYSGGGDSTGVLILLHRLYQTYPVFELCCVYVNHALQPHGAQIKEREIVVKNCQYLDIPVYIYPETQDSSSPRVRNEADARRYRYNYIRKCALSRSIDILITAHQIDDLAETVLMRLLEGRGREGLAGIPIISRLTDSCLIFRPCISYTHSARQGLSSGELKHIVDLNGLEYHRDRSNSEHMARRNIIRNQIIPTIEEYFHETHLRIASSAEHLREVLDDDQALLAYYRWFWNSNTSNARVISMNRVLFDVQAHSIKKKILYSGLNLLGISDIGLVFIQEVIESVDTKSSTRTKSFRIGNVRLHFNSKRIRICELTRLDLQDKSKQSHAHHHTRNPMCVPAQNSQQVIISLPKSNRSIEIRHYSDTELEDYSSIVGIEYLLCVADHFEIDTINKHDVIEQGVEGGRVLVNIKDRYARYNSLIDWQDILILRDRYGIAAVLGECILLPCIVRPKLEIIGLRELKIKQGYEKIAVRSI